MSRVIVYEPVKNDLTAAALHGPITYLWDTHHRRPSIWETNEFKEAVLDRLTELKFDPECDYFAVVGSVVPTTLIIDVLCTMYTKYKVLLWHAEHRDYLVRALGTYSYIEKLQSGS